MQPPKIDRGDPTQAARRGVPERRAEAAGAPFQSVLAARRPARHERRPTDGGTTGDASAALAALAGRPAAAPASSIAAPEPRVREISVRAAAPAVEVARVLVGQAHAAREARIELGGGLFAGSAIHLVTSPGGIEVRVGATTEAARLALASALDRVGLHLRSRGIVMRPGAPLDTGSRQGRRQGR